METSLLIAVFFIAILYASVGHGGASGYLAVMALFAMDPVMMKSSALTLNLFVAGISFYAFYKAGYFNPRLWWPFALTSVPFAFLGGTMNVNPRIYKVILGIFLIFAVFRIVFRPKGSNEITKIHLPLALFTGAVLGIFSGMIGIGGGIILSPLILLLGWGNIKETAATSALFILVNSVAGLAGLISQGATFSPLIPFLAGAGILGGLIGARMGSMKVSFVQLKYLLSFVLLFAGIKLILF
ncbi:MAG: sulfite exporter TauE/SafE family protein [Chlorobi bacterium]|nr:sulfite exporter TauE/SafE family protein [Chlorobiota bacterium]